MRFKLDRFSNQRKCITIYRNK